MGLALEWYISMLWLALNGACYGMVSTPCV